MSPKQNKANLDWVWGREDSEQRELGLFWQGTRGWGQWESEGQHRECWKGWHTLRASEAMLSDLYFKNHEKLLTDFQKGYFLNSCFQCALLLSFSSHQKKKKRKRKKLPDSLSGHVAPLLLITFPSAWFLALVPGKQCIQFPDGVGRGACTEEPWGNQAGPCELLVSSAPSVTQGSIRTH